MRKLIVSVVTAAALVTGACGGSDSTDSNSTTPTTEGSAAPVIKASGTVWQPAEITAKVGETVTWEVKKGLIHDLVGEDGVKHEAANEFTYTHVYNTAGEFAYQCTLHGGMTGTVTVA